jgi:hypothetical protein
VLIDGAVQVTPLASNFDVGFINPDRAAMGSAKLAQPLFKHGRLGPNPTIDGAVVDLEAALSQHLFQVAIAQRLAQVPGNRLNDQPCLEMPSFEIILRLTLQLFRNGSPTLGP